MRDERDDDGLWMKENTMQYRVGGYLAKETSTDLTSVLMMTSLLCENLPSSAAILSMKMSL